MSKDLKTVVLEDWVRKLRSKEYRQTTLVLINSTGKRCALGVLSESLFDVGELPKLTLTYSDDDVNYYDKMSEYLQTIDMVYEDIYDLNDTNELSFEEIADFVEAKMKEKR